MQADLPFDRNLRRLRRDRAARDFEGADYLHRLAVDELVERLEAVTRTFRRALVLGSAGHYAARLLAERGLEVVEADAGPIFATDVQCDEDRLPFADGAFDLVLSVGVLDGVNDLPGALVLIRRALRAEGLFLGAFAGAGSLPRLRSAMLAADSVRGEASAHIHPQIDVRAAGDLLGRAGFALPVADSESVPVRFPHLLRLVHDLRTMAGTSILATRARRPIGKAGLAAALADFAAAADPDGRTEERFEIVYLTGWSP